MAVIDLKNCEIDIVGGGVGETLEVKIGEGNLTYSETKNRQYILDRGSLATGNVRDGDESPVEVTLSFTWEWLRSVSGDEISVEEALKKTGEASDWTTVGDDPCEPYAVDIVFKNLVPCGDTLDEIITFHEFRYEKLDHDAKAGTVSVSGKCRETAPTIVRTNDT